ncbi:hypothetical protein PMI04_005610 [Sphingobium sp. AP49]|uniref:hypothetical protein n=1 Tax=Sphingobium sp. AP49 TaxID=1144307 RepID=UPI0012F679B7|nr:hypothetical protein [Sphingobium sp. AP49]WHO40069.1 hypothetical protein PMI04_005610 [Sphingobium sp. AP49]
MEFDIARRLMIELRKSDVHLNAISHIVEEIEDQDERKKMRRRIAGIVTEIYTEIWRPLEREHPSLEEK